MYPPPRYTLEEAEKILNEKKCRAEGHHYDIITKRTGFHTPQPIKIICLRCKETWNIENKQKPNEAPTQLIPRINADTEVFPRY